MFVNSLFRKVSKLIIEKNKKDVPGVLVQRMISVVPSQSMRYLDNRPEDADIVCLSEDGKFERLPRRDPEELDNWPGLNMRGFAFMMAENAFCAIMEGYEGYSENYFANYTIGRDDSRGAVAYAIYDPETIGSHGLVERKYLKPIMVYVVSVCRERNSMEDRELAMAAEAQLKQWCANCKLEYHTHLLSRDDL